MDLLQQYNNLALIQNAEHQHIQFFVVRAIYANFIRSEHSAVKDNMKYLNTSYLLLCCPSYWYYLDVERLSKTSSSRWFLDLRYIKVKWAIIVEKVTWVVSKNYPQKIKNKKFILKYLKTVRIFSYCGNSYSFQVLVSVFQGHAYFA